MQFLVCQQCKSLAMLEIKSAILVAYISYQNQIRIFLTLAEVSRLLLVYLHLRQLLIVHLLSLLPPNTIRVRGIQMITCILLLQATSRQYGMESNLATSKSCIPPNQALQSACIRSTFCDNCNLLK